MRDPERLDKFYTKLCRVHKEYLPDWRFMQLISNLAVFYGADPFYMEDDKAIELLDAYMKDLIGDRYKG